MARIMSKARQQALSDCRTGSDSLRPFSSIALFVQGGRQYEQDTRDYLIMLAYETKSLKHGSESE
jgi:hypothetical protein